MQENTQDKNVTAASKSNDSFHVMALSLEEQLKKLTEENAMLSEQLHMVQDELVKYVGTSAYGGVTFFSSSNRKQVQTFFSIYTSLRKSEIENSLQYRIGNAILKLKSSGVFAPFKLLGVLLFFAKKKIPTVLGKDFSKVIEIHAVGGYKGVKKLLDSVKITSTIKANAFTAIAKHLQERDLTECCKYAEYAYKTDPQAYRLKWWILCLCDKGDYTTAGVLAHLLSRDCPVSEEEKRKLKHVRQTVKYESKKLVRAYYELKKKLVAKNNELNKIKKKQIRDIQYLKNSVELNNVTLLTGKNITSLMGSNTFDVSDCAELSMLCDKYGSDKGSLIQNIDEHHPYNWHPHTYTDIYSLLFKNIKHTAKNIFECGIGTNNPNMLSNMTINGKLGASLYVWRDYFKVAQIYGVDIDKDILFSDDRIQTDWMDQTSPDSIRDYFQNLKIRFDIMIDDGLHTPDAAICLFTNSIDFLEDDGIYIIEDMQTKDMEKLKEFFSHKNEYCVKYVLMNTQIRSNNNLVIIRKNINILM